MKGLRLPDIKALCLLLSAVVLLLLLAPRYAAADPPDSELSEPNQPFSAAAKSGWEIAPFAALHLGGDFNDNVADIRFDAREGVAFGVILAIPDKADTRYELLYAFQRTDISAKRMPGAEPLFDLDIHYLHIGGSYRFMEGKVQPFVSGGVGASHFVPRGNGLASKTYFSVSLGVGVTAPVYKSVSLRIEGRGFLTILPENSTVFCVSSGGVTCAVKAQGDVFGQFLLMTGIVFSL